MPITKTPCPLTFADIVSAELVPAQLSFPPAVADLSQYRLNQLLSDPLTPVSRDSVLYQAQRALLLLLSMESYSRHLRVYCRHLRILTPTAWGFVLAHGKPDYVKVPAAVSAGTLTDMEGPAITNLYVHWIELQRHAGLSSQRGVGQSA